jgi:hypothetical protein
MKKFLLVLMAVCLTFAMISCGDKPGTSAGSDFTISFDLNWPDDAEGSAPTPPGSIGINKVEGEEFGRLTAIQISGVSPSSAQRPSGYRFVAWYTTKEGADDLTSSLRVSTATEFEADATLYAGWEVFAVDMSGSVELITLNNGQYALYEFDIGTNTFADYENIQAEIMVDSGSLSKSVRAFRILGNYVPTYDFTFVVGDEGSDVEGVTRVYAVFNNDSPLNKNAPYIMQNAPENQTFATYIANQNSLAVEDVLAETWYTINYPDFSAASPHGGFEAKNKPAATATGKLYFAIGFPSGNNDPNSEVTFYIKNVKMIGTDSDDTITAVPVIYQDGDDLYPGFAGWPDVSGDNGFSVIGREYVGEGPDPAPLAMPAAGTSFTVTFDYNYPPAGTPPSPLPSAKTADTSATTGRLPAADVAAPASAAFPTSSVANTSYKFDGWNTAADGTGFPVTASTLFQAAGTAYAQWSTQTKQAPTVALVVTNFEFGAYGNNSKATYDTTSQKATYVPGTGDGNSNVVGATEYALMVSSAFGTTATGAGTDSLPGASFPAAIDDYIYTKVIVTYDAIVPTHIIGNSTETAVTGTGLAGNLKSGYPNSWSGTSPGTYPEFTAGTDQTLTWDLSLFGTTITGFSLQYHGNTAGQPDNSATNGWLLKITKLEFTTQALIDAGTTVDQVAGDFSITGATSQTYGTVAGLTITPTTGGAVSNITYTSTTSTTYPAVGVYNVTFNAAATAGKNATTGISAGTLTITQGTLTAALYTLSGNTLARRDTIAAVTVTPVAATSTTQAAPSTGITIKYDDVDTVPTAYAASFAITIEVDGDENWEGTGTTDLALGDLTIANGTPVADDFDITGLEAAQTVNATTGVSIIVKAGDYTGGTVENIMYGTEADADDLAVGTYPVTFDVTEDLANGWEAVTGLVAGEIEIE